MTSKGIAEDKLSSKGWGETKPIADNETDDGKAKNRRVEFIITAQDQVKKWVEVDPATGEKKDVSAPQAPQGPSK